MGRKKQTSKIFFPENAHLDAQVVFWMATCKRQFEYLVYAGEKQADQVRSQGWSRWKKKGDPQVYADRDSAKENWSIVEVAMSSELKLAVDKEIKRRQDKTEQESELRDKLWMNSTYSREKYNIATPEILKECLDMLLADTGNSEESKRNTVLDMLKKAISSLSFKANLSTVKAIAIKLEPFKTPEEKKEEETEEKE